MIYHIEDIPSHLREFFEPAPQLGLEPTIEEFVANMVEVFGLVRELLKDDGTLWLNLGDSYNSIGHKKSNSGYGSTGLAGGIAQEHTPLHRENNSPGLKQKDLCGVPWQVAFALRADGWYLRQDIIWHKPNPMPESIRDRCTKAHEYLFLLAKSERYLCDMEAIAEPVNGDPNAPRNRWDTKDYEVPGQKPQKRTERTKIPGGWETKLGSHGTIHREGRTSAEYQEASVKDVRNKRSVWTVSTHAYPEAHFATYPPALIEPCILAGSKPGDIVFDPFFGSGTTGEVAQRLGRNWLGCELSPEYAKLAERRTSGTIGMQLVNA